MSNVLKLLLKLTGCEAAHGAETYETTQPWVCYWYRYTDRALTLFARTFIRATCCICGEHEDILVRGTRSGPVEDRGPHPLRTRFLQAHRHPGVNRNPMSWALPLKNPAALQDGLMRAPRRERGSPHTEARDERRTLLPDARRGPQPASRADFVDE